MIDRSRLSELTERELARFAAAHPRSRELSLRARRSMVGGVPMPWMRLWAGGMRATLTGVLTPGAYQQMIALATRFTSGCATSSPVPGWAGM